MRNYLLGAALLTAAACSDTTTPKNALRPMGASNDVDQTQKIPSALATINPCNGDAVELTGTLTVIVHATTSTSGNQHAFYSLTGTYSGLGLPSGAKYTGQTQNKESFSSNDPYPIVDDMIAVFTVRSAGSTANFIVRVHYHVTINANGVPTVDSQEVSNSCNG